MQARKNRKLRTNTLSFELPIDGRKYEVVATPFTVATGDTLFRVSYDHSPVHVLAWDDGLNRYAEADSMADVIPPVIEMAIAGKLHDFASQIQHAA